MYCYTVLASCLGEVEEQQTTLAVAMPAKAFSGSINFSCGYNRLMFAITYANDVVLM